MPLTIGNLTFASRNVSVGTRQNLSPLDELLWPLFGAGADFASAGISTGDTHAQM